MMKKRKQTKKIATFDQKLTVKKIIQIKGGTATDDLAKWRKN